MNSWYSERIHPDDRVWWKRRVERAIQEKTDYDEVVRLLLSRSIVESHGGRLWATPNDERGTSFHFTLPIEIRESSHLAT